MADSVQGNYENLASILGHLRDKDQLPLLIWYFEHLKEKSFQFVLDKGSSISEKDITRLQAEMEIYDDLINIERKVGEAIKAYGKKSRGFKVSF